MPKRKEIVLNWESKYHRREGNAIEGYNALRVHVFHPSDVDTQSWNLTVCKTGFKMTEELCSGGIGHGVP